MTSKTTGIMLTAGIIIGVIACLGTLMLTQTGPFGDCIAILPLVSAGPQGIGSDMGEIQAFSSEEQAQKFLISHTDMGVGSSGTGISAPKKTAVSLAPGRERTWSFNVDTSTLNRMDISSLPMLSSRQQPARHSSTCLTGQPVPS